MHRWWSDWNGWCHFILFIPITETKKNKKKWKSRCFDSSWQLFHRSCSEEPTGTASNLDSSTIELISPVHSDALGARFWTLLWNIVRKRVELAAPQESLVVVDRCNIKRLFISTVVPEISGKSPFDFSCAISVHKKSAGFRVLGFYRFLVCITLLAVWTCFDDLGCACRHCFKRQRIISHLKANLIVHWAKLNSWSSGRNELESSSNIKWLPYVN